MAGSEAFGRMLDSLGDPYRRRVLAALADVESRDVEGPLIADTKVKQLHFDVVREDTSEIAAVHSHLPKLDDMGYIAWDESTGEVSKGERWEEIAPLIHLFRDHDDDIGIDWV